MSHTFFYFSIHEQKTGQRCNKECSAEAAEHDSGPFVQTKRGRVESQQTFMVKWAYTHLSMRFNVISCIIT